ncbi:hypothetical protein NWP21_17620 [Anabaenopsis sp. FSS-46]|uniref:hypothetical protein n=1 Tax=Anabaenopsis sp. FSS-46 TaxID=2971766 RepID=UPI0024762A6A|nr:hypothetical protein [Anabaenopsis sp. FSS-46]MDH6100622.1 hypothetical protein [Anabaenopsis sp. FSS-46]
MTISIGDTAKELGVSVKTVRLSHYHQTAMKQEVNAKTAIVQVSLDLGSFG